MGKNDAEIQSLKNEFNEKPNEIIFDMKNKIIVSNYLFVFSLVFALLDNS